MKVWIYVDKNYQVGHPDHLKVFADDEAAEVWFEEHDPEGVAFEYVVIANNRAIASGQPELRESQKSRGNSFRE